jgi:3'5'-cyclic nucleotide phosphodiesterase
MIRTSFNNRSKFEPSLNSPGVNRKSTDINKREIKRRASVAHLQSLPPNTSFLSKHFSGSADIEEGVVAVSAPPVKAVQAPKIQSNNGTLTKVVQKNYTLKRMGHFVGKYESNIRGHIRIHMRIQYSFMALLLLVCRIGNFLIYIQWYQIVMFAVLCGFVEDISRWIDSKYSTHVSWWALSLLPLSYVMLVQTSGSRGMFAMVWMILVDLVFLQSAQPKAARDITINFLAIQLINFVFEFFSKYYHNDCTDIGTCYLSLQTVLSQKVFFILSSSWIHWMFLILEKLIHVNALALLDREDYLQQLYLAHIELKRQMRKFDMENHTILESPLEAAIHILKHIIDEVESDDVADQIITIIELLSKDELMKPELIMKNDDSEVRDWLKGIMITESQYEYVADNIYCFDMDVHADSQGSLSLKNLDFQLHEYLQTSGDPDFDVLQLEVMTNGHALFYLSIHFFHKFHLSSRLKINPDVFKNWITKIEKDYRHANPYHNSTHAADVLYSFCYFFSKHKIRPHLSNDEVLSCLVASIVHDYMHPGVNNAFLIATSNPLAIRYNDQSVLECFHAASLFEIMRDPELDILASFGTDQKKNIREMIIGMILATDMSAHFDWIGKFKTKMASTGINFELKADKKMCLNLTIKCADVNNSAKNLAQCRKWTHLIMEEFFLQGDAEKQKGIPVSAFMNRDTTDIPKCQIVIYFNVRDL